MILVMFLMFFATLGFSVHLLRVIQISKKKHASELKKLNNVIQLLLQEQKKQTSKLKLSDDLKARLFEAQSSIDENIMGLQHDLFEIVSKVPD